MISNGYSTSFLSELVITAPYSSLLLFTSPLPYIGQPLSSSSSMKSSSEGISSSERGGGVQVGPVGSNSWSSSDSLMFFRIFSSW